MKQKMVASDIFTTYYIFSVNTSTIDTEILRQILKDGE